MTQEDFLSSSAKSYLNTINKLISLLKVTDITLNYINFRSEPEHLIVTEFNTDPILFDVEEQELYLNEAPIDLFHMKLTKAISVAKKEDEKFSKTWEKITEL